MYQVKLFATTMVADREALGATISAWVRENRLIVEQLELRLTSDDEYHCLSATALYRPAGKGVPGIMRAGALYERVEMVSATKAKERVDLGSKLGSLTDLDAFEVLQSSDSQFHCIVLVAFRAK